MTLEEKASQLVNQARAIPRLNVPAYDWWSESLHGVAVNGTTEFPEPVGLAATFDIPRIYVMATIIGIEGRIKHAQDKRAGHSNIFEGLDFWAPNVNIFRDPRWGRGQETYGEDPFLSARVAVAFVTGMQGDDPNYYRVTSTPKHFGVHSGPEPTRHFTDVDVSKHDQEDTYLPAFRAAVVEGHAGSVMCAYNAVNGQPACAPKAPSIPRSFACSPHVCVLACSTRRRWCPIRRGWTHPLLRCAHERSGAVYVSVPSRAAVASHALAA